MSVYISPYLTINILTLYTLYIPIYTPNTHTIYTQYIHIYTAPNTNPLLTHSYTPIYRTCEFAFETLGVPALFTSKEAVLSCYATGRTSGCVVDMGYSGKYIDI